MDNICSKSQSLYTDIHKENQSIKSRNGSISTNCPQQSGVAFGIQVQETEPKNHLNTNDLYSKSIDNQCPPQFKDKPYTLLETIFRLVSQDETKSAPEGDGGSEDCLRQAIKLGVIPTFKNPQRALIFYQYIKRLVNAIPEDVLLKELQANTHNLLDTAVIKQDIDIIQILVDRCGIDIITTKFNSQFNFDNLVTLDNWPEKIIKRLLECNYSPTNNQSVICEMLKNIIQHDNYKLLRSFTEIYGSAVLLQPINDSSTTALTALDFSVKYGKKYCVHYLLTQKPVFDQLRWGGPLYINDGPSHACNRMVTQAKEYIPWQTLTGNATQQESKFVLSDSLWTEDAKRPASCFENKAKKVLKAIGNRVGVYLTVTICESVQEKFPSKYKHSFWSLGDLAAGIQIVRNLQHLGVAEIVILLPPPDDSMFYQRSDYDQQKKREYDNKKDVTRNQLAIFLPEFDSKKDLPQGFKLGTSNVVVRDCDDDEKFPQVCFSFLLNKSILTESGKSPESNLCLKSYRFAEKKIETNIDQNRPNYRYRPTNIPFDFPPNSMVPTYIQAENIKPEHIKNETLVKVIHHLIKKNKQNEINTSCVYGLHHSRVAFPERILEKFIANINSYTNKYTKDQPTIFAVSGCLTEESMLREFAVKQQLTLIDLTHLSEVNDQTIDLNKLSKENNQKIVNKEDDPIIKQLNALKAKEKALCILPSLPKYLFDQLIMSSQLPTLTEGANLTAFLIEAGKPHLSVLPNGDTEIAQDMGDPFEAIKAEAFSCKLVMSENEHVFLSSIKQKVDQGDYTAALEDINTARKQYKFEKRGEFRNLCFLSRDSDSETTLDLKQINIKNLLEKGNKLGPLGKKTLLSALDPSPEAFTQYIADAMDENSATVHHLKLQKMHVTRTFLNPVNLALVQLGKYKGIFDKPSPTSGKDDNTELYPSNFLTP